MKTKIVGKIFVLFICAIFFASAISAQDKCNTYSEPSIGVSFCAPQNWSIRKKTDKPYADVLGETRNGLTPNINVRSESFDGSLSEYFDGAMKYVLETKAGGSASKIEVKSKGKFAADTQGFKVVYNIEARGANIRSVQYVFKGAGNSIIIITATLPAADADALESVIETSVKTLKITTDKHGGIGTDKISSVGS